MKKVIGYTRLSTNMQLLESNTLKLQARNIMAAAEKHGFDLLGIYEDVGSAARLGSLKKRGDLLSALVHAKQTGAMLVVTDTCRLFRNVQDAKVTLATYDIEVFSITENRIVPRKTLLQQIKKAQSFAEAVQNGTRCAKIQQGQPTALQSKSKGLLNSAIARKNRSMMISEAIADILRGLPGHEKLKHREVAELLNARGVCSGQNRNWTAGSVRRQRDAAVKILREREELEKASIPFNEGISSSEEATLREEMCERKAIERMMNLPTYGMF